MVMVTVCILLTEPTVEDGDLTKEPSSTRMSELDKSVLGELWWKRYGYLHTFEHPSMHYTDKGYLHTSEHPFIHALHRYGYLNTSEHSFIHALHRYGYLYTSRHPSIHWTDKDTCILPGIHPCTAQIPAYFEHPLSAVPFSMVFSIFVNLHSSITAHLTSAFRYRTLTHLLPQCSWPPKTEGRESSRHWGKFWVAC